MTTTEFPATVSATDTALNKAIGLKAQSDLIEKKDFTALDKYWKEDYVQHNPALRNGLAELKIFKLANVPLATSEIVRCLGDRDLVFFLERVTGLVATPLCFFDIYRMEDGKVVEHWDAFIPVDDSNPLGRSMFDGTLELGDPESTEATRAVAIKLITNVFILDHLDRLETYVHDSLRQYTPGLTDGVDALRQHFRTSQWFTGAIDYRALRHVIAEGDFALTVSEATIGEDPYAIFDLWRIEDGKASDHWSLRQKIETSAFHHNPRV